MMNSSIILLSGTPSGKKNFINIAREDNWVWNLNIKDRLTEVAEKELGYKGERDEAHYKFISKFLSLLDSTYNYQEKFLTEKIQKFLSEEREYFADSTGKKFHNYLMIIHGVTPKMVYFLKENYGVFQIYVSEKKLNTVGGRFDNILYEDDEDFPEKCKNTLNILLGGNN